MGAVDVRTHRPPSAAVPGVVVGRRAMKDLISTVGVGAVLASSVMLAAIADAQSPQPGQVAATISGIAPVPVGPLIDNRDVGIGGSAGLRYAPTTAAPLAIRVELSGLLPSSHDRGGPSVATQVTNGSSAIFAAGGPEFDIPAMSGHFYTTAAAGIAHIWGSSSASNSTDTPLFGAFYTLTTRQVTNFAWGAGGGFITPRSRSGFAGDISVHYDDLGRATYTTSYPSLATGQGTVMTKAYATTGRHRVTFVAPTLGVS